MTLRCSFITSSYLSTFLRISKLRSSTVPCARSTALRDHLRLERHVVGERRVHHPLHQPGREQAHQLVFEREVEAALAGVALTAGAAAQLVVDAARLVPLGAEHVEAAEGADLVALDLALLLEARQQLVVAGVDTRRRAERRGPRWMHSRRARPSGLPPSRMSTPRPAMFVATVTADELARLRDDLGFPLVLLRVQHLVRDALLLEQARQLLRLLDRDRADEHGLALARGARRCRRPRRRTCASSPL